MKKLVSLCLASVLFLGSATLFLGCGGSGPSSNEEATVMPEEMPDPGEMDTTGTGQAEPAGPTE